MEGVLRREVDPVLESEDRGRRRVVEGTAEAFAPEGGDGGGLTGGGEARGSLGGDWRREIAEKEGLPLLGLGARGPMHCGAHFGVLGLGFRMRRWRGNPYPRGRSSFFFFFFMSLKSLYTVI